MKNIFVLASALLVLVGSVNTANLSQSARAADNALYSRFLCRNRQNGFKTIVPGSCTSYYTCYNGASLQIDCPYYYDGVKKMCVDQNPGCVEDLAEVATAPRAISAAPCDGIVKGYVVGQNQAEWYQCLNSAVISSGVCPSGQEYNLILLQCDVKSSCGGADQPSCSGNDGTTPAPATEAPTQTPCAPATITTSCAPTTTTTIRPPITTTTTCAPTTTTTTRAPITTTTTCAPTTTTTTCARITTTTTCAPTTTTTTRAPITTTTTCAPTTTTTTRAPTTTTTTCAPTTTTTTRAPTTTTTTCAPTTTTTTRAPTTTTTTCAPTVTPTVTPTPCSPTTVKPPCTRTTPPCTTTPCPTITTPCPQSSLYINNVPHETPSETLQSNIFVRPSQQAVRPISVLPPQSHQSNMDLYIKYVCQDKPTGFMLPSLRSCNEYFICRNGLALKVSCGSAYFNAMKGQCDLPANSGCIQPYQH
uniref:Chitin-binding type-2 domain-containing protein n=1 Tax=Bactrocera latifrons TaxID=174628 RepID=A0A0K8UXH6_BACLA